jgi:Stress responsive A/B Barrel Domain.
MVKHIVFWKINEGGTAADRERTCKEFCAKIEYLKTIIPQIKTAVVGLNYIEGDVFHICIDSIFESDGDLQAYINHPEHLKVREFMNSVSYDKTVFDYNF